MKWQYKRTSYDKNSETKQTGAMCSWFNSTNSKIFELNADSGTIEHTIETHSFLSVTSYLCTLSRGCFESLGIAEKQAVVKSLPLMQVDNSTQSNLYHHSY